MGRPSGTLHVTLFTMLGLAVVLYSYSARAEETPSEEEWAEVSSILDQYSPVVFREPPLRSNFLTEKRTPVAPISGNGGFGVVLIASEDELEYYLTSHRFWPFSTTATVTITNSCRGEGTIPYRSEEDLSNGELRASLKFNGNPIHARTFCAPNDQTLITELWAENKNQEVTVKVHTSIHGGKVDKRGQPPRLDSGKDGGIGWMTKHSSASENPKDGRRQIPALELAVATKVLGGTVEEIVTQHTEEQKSTNTTKKDQRGATPASATITVSIPAGKHLYVVTNIDAGLDKEKDWFAFTMDRLKKIDVAAVKDLDEQRSRWWKDYWLKSYIDIPNGILEEFYYAELYVLATAYRKGSNPPHLYGPWVGGGPMWGGGYTLNANMAQKHFGQVSANRLEQDNFYEMSKALMPAGRKEALAMRKVGGKHYPNGLRGIRFYQNGTAYGSLLNAGFPHLLYNASLSALNFIRYYEYTYDPDFLKEYAYPFVKEVALFWTDALQLDESGRYVVVGAKARESSHGDTLNPVNTLAMARTALIHAIRYSESLSVDKELRKQWQDILDNYSDVPTGQKAGRVVIAEYEGSDGGFGVVRCVDAYPHDKLVYDLLRSSIVVGERQNQGKYFETHEARVAALVGTDGNETYTKLSNAIGNVRRHNLIYGTKNHTIEPMSVGMAAVNAMLLCSDREPLIFFPCWPDDKDSKFIRLRARGGLLVDGSLKGNVVRCAAIYSEQGADCVVQNPWPGKNLTVRCGDNPVSLEKEGDVYRFKTVKGSRYVLQPQGGFPEPARPVNIALNKPATQSSTVNSGKKVLNLVEVEVYGQDVKVNLAPDKTVTQSSTDGGRVAGKAIDGRNDSADLDSCARTTEESEPWWLLDLGKSQVVSTINVYYLSDFGDFTLSILDDNKETVWSKFMVGSRTKYDRPLITDSSNNMAEQKRGKGASRKRKKDSGKAGDRQAGSLLCSTTFVDSVSDILKARYGVYGRYVKIQLKKAGKPAGAVDGNVVADLEPNSVTLTEEDQGAWWEVDLQKPHPIGDIMLHNSSRYSSGCLRDFAIFVLDEDRKVVWRNQHKPAAGGLVAFNARGTRGRYVRIQLSADGRVKGNSGRRKARYVKDQKKAGTDGLTRDRLSLSEVIVHEYTGTPPVEYANIALGKTATASSTDGKCDAAKAIDGNTDGDLSAGSVARTRVENKPWWQVDLGGNHLIDKIQVHNRTDADTTVMKNFIVEVLDGRKNIVWKRQWRNYPNPRIYFKPEQVTGRYVRVTLAYKQSLNLAEVEVYGNEGDQR